MKTPQHILIARLSSIGDIILTTPVIRVVHQAYPEAKISFLVKKEYASLLDNNPDIHQLIIFDKAGGWKELHQLRKKIANEKFDWFIDLHNNLRTNFLKFTIRFPEVSSYSKQTMRRWLLVKAGTNLLKEAKPIYLKYFDALKKRGLTYDNKGTAVFLTDKVIDSIDQKLETDGIDATRSLVVICPGASFWNKQWPGERFGKLADTLIENKNVQVIFLGGPNDQELCRSITGSMKNNALNYAGQLPLSGSAALLRKASLVVTNDSGMMHLAQSQHARVVAIFGPTTRELGFFPIPLNSQVVEKQLSCRPCTTKGLDRCPKKHFNCMKGIELKDVLEALQKF